MPVTIAPLETSPRPLLPLASLPDEALARGCSRGDERAFEAIYARYHGPLYRYCRSVVRTHEDAEEALQTTMMKAYRALRDGARVVTVRPWLYRIAHNECVRSLTRRSSHAELTGFEHVVGDQSEERAEVLADLEQLRRDLAALPEGQRSALVLRELSGLSHREIGQALGTTPVAVKQLIYEARQTLHEFGEGRALACAEVRAHVSDGDGRILRGRRIRAHLRTCSGCRAYRERLTTRPRQLAALFPVLPTLAARSVLDAVLGGAGAGGAGVLGAAGLGGMAVKAATVGALALLTGAVALAPSPSAVAPRAGWASAAASPARGLPPGPSSPGPLRQAPVGPAVEDPAHPAAPGPAAAGGPMTTEGTPAPSLGRPSAAAPAQDSSSPAAALAPAAGPATASAAPAAIPPPGAAAGANAPAGPAQGAPSAQGAAAGQTAAPDTAAAAPTTPTVPTPALPVAGVPAAPALPAISLPTAPSSPSPPSLPALPVPTDTVPSLPPEPPAAPPQPTVPSATQLLPAPPADPLTTVVFSR